MLLLLATAAHAGGYFYSDSGILATGRGGAFVAGAYGQYAQRYNPAGLVHTDRPTITVGWSGVQQAITFTRLAEDGTRLDPAVNQASPFDVPELGFVTPVGSRVAVAFGFTSPYAPSSKYDEEGAQRYSIKKTALYEFDVGPSVAVRVHPMLSVGASFQWHYFDVSQSVDATFSGQDDPTGDIAVDVRTVDKFTPNWNAGLQFTPHRAITFGLAVQPGTKYGARGEMGLDFTGNVLADVGVLSKAKYRDADVGLDLSLPWVLRGGVAVRPVDRLELELATVWQDWSSLGDIVVSDVNIDLQWAGIPLGEVAETLTIPVALKDTVSIRLGGEWRAHEHLSLRAGGFWENGAVDAKDLSVALVDPPKVQVGGGASGFFVDDRLRFDAAFAWLFFPDQEVRDSNVVQIAAQEGTQTVVVGNGDYQSHGWILGLGAQVAFGQRRAPWQPK